MARPSKPKPPTLADLPPLVKVDPAAAFLQLGSAAVRSAIRRGDLPSKRWGRLIFIPRAALARYLELPDPGPVEATKPE